VALEEPKSNDKTFDDQGLRWAISDRDFAYLRGARLRVEHHEKPWGNFFHVAKISAYYDEGDACGLP
jgi:hypothetical protein